MENIHKTWKIDQEKLAIAEIDKFYPFVVLKEERV